MSYKIKERRELLKLSQEELANKAGLSRVTISRLESGIQPDILVSNLKKVAEALDCTVADLL